MIWLWELALGCSPFGVRLAMGEGYNPVHEQPTLLTIGFNSKEECTPRVQVENKSVACLSELVFVNATNLGVDYEYRTWVYVCKIDTRLPRVFNYSINQQQFQGTLYHPDQQGLRRFLVMGNWGTINQNKDYLDVLPCVNRTIHQNSIGAILFLGNMAFDLQSGNCDKYEQFLRLMEPISSRVPFTVVRGERQNGGRMVSSHLFNKTFSMPQQYKYNNSMYSTSVGDVHFSYIDLSSAIKGPDNRTLQFLNKDFKLNKGTWNFVVSAQEFYCSYDNVSNPCLQFIDALKPYTDFFHTHNVDMHFGGHQPIYQRMFPITANGQKAKFKQQMARGHAVMINLQSPVYVVEGDAGNDFFLNNQNYSLKNITAAASINAGFGILTVHNQTTISYEHFKADFPQCLSNDIFEIRRDKRWELWWLGTGGLLCGVVLILVAYKLGQRKGEEDLYGPYSKL